MSSLTCITNKAQSFYWDTKTPCLGVRVTSTGAKAYIFEVKLFGKTIRITIGNTDSWALGQAQNEARRLKVLVDAGIDPRQEKTDKQAQAEAKAAEIKRQNVIVADMWTEYIEAGKTKWGELHCNDHIRLASAGGEKKQRTKGVRKAGVLSSLMGLRFVELTEEVLIAWLQNESIERATQAALGYRLLRAFVRWAHEDQRYTGIVDPQIFGVRKVKEKVQKPNAKKDDTLSREHLTAWFDAVLNIPNHSIRVYLISLVLTGARPHQEMAMLKWDDVGFEWGGRLVLHDKIEGERIIPLPPFLAHLIKQLPRINEYVYWSETAEHGHITNVYNTHSKALKAAGLPHVSLHGLRRSFSNLAEWAEAPEGVIKQIMGHAPTDTHNRVYKNRPLDLLRLWHHKIEAWILKEAGIEFIPAPVPAKSHLRVVNG
ncbi:tyrosine-type recombinase/integrase [Formosimonas limnophila]|uniref:tyrosine-type recombinase/integrase n=1 Tax=Formosimonas limnophila TaxID=1384487 RepID=UPI001E603499|nr:integrase family protein [Formosimonas limnophila]